MTEFSRFVCDELIALFANDSHLQYSSFRPQRRYFIFKVRDSQQVQVSKLNGL